MLSPANAIAVAVLVVAVGGLLAAQLGGPDPASAPASSASQEPGLPSASPAADQSQPAVDPMAASYWTGTWDPIGEVGVTASRDGYVEEMGGSNRGEVAADDPRIAGRMTRVYNAYSTVGPEPERDLHIRHGTARIDNDAGTWVGTSTAWIAGWLADEFYVLEGEGAYEGLTAVFQLHPAEGSLAGVILAAELPPPPDPVAPPAE
jgi:hypothetical protein